jgi:hypothetical protein
MLWITPPDQRQVFFPVNDNYNSLLLTPGCVIDIDSLLLF